jgi:hypothetical protein
MFQEPLSFLKNTNCTNCTNFLCTGITRTNYYEHELNVLNG